MRASATSRLAPPAAAHAARTDNNAPKSDEASPFALLVGAVTPPASKAGTSGGKGNEKPDTDQASTDQASAAPDASAPTQATLAQTAPTADNSQQPPADANPGASQTDPALAPDAPQPDINLAALNTNPPQPVASDSKTVADADAGAGTGSDNVALWPQSARPAPATIGKPAKADKTDKKEQPAPAEIAAAAPAADLPPPALQSAAVTPVAAPQAPVTVTPDDAGQVDPAATPAIAPATSPAASQPAPQATDSDQGPAPQAPDQAPGPQATDHQTAPQLPASQPATPAPATPAPATPASAKTAAASAGAPAPDGASAAQDQTLADNAAQVPAKSQPKPAAPKVDAIAKTAKPLPGKQPQQTSDPAAVKSADATAVQSGDDADDAFKPDAAAPAANAAAAKTVSDAITMPTVSQPAAPQTQGPALTQHIQVTAQPRDTAPNLPALAVEIAAKAQAGAKQFDIRLDPPELGRVDVRLSIDATGKASAHLSADQPQTLSLLQKDAPALTRALREAGLDVSQDGLNFSLRQQAGHDSGAGAQSGHRSGRGFSLAATTSIEATATSAAYSGSADGRLDIRV